MLVVKCTFTMVPLKTTAARESADALVQMIGNHGVPLYVISDTAPDFTSELINEVT